MKHARVTIFAGHYGSGKTTVAVNYALALAQAQPQVALCDMDIVNPYFRSADFAQLLDEAGVELISSPYANTNVEVLGLPTQALRIFDDPGLTGVIDLGGDDCGAMAIGRYAARLQGRDDVALWLVVNPCRPLTRDTDALRDVRDEIEAAAKLRFCGIINNTNLGVETTAETIQSHFGFVREAGEALALPVIMTCVKRGLDVAVPPGLGEKFEVECWGNRFGV